MAGMVVLTASLALRSIGSWLARELQRRGLSVIVVEARHMRSSLSATREHQNRMLLAESAIIGITSAADAPAP
jgi:transposase